MILTFIILLVGLDLITLCDIHLVKQKICLRIKSIDKFQGKRIKYHNNQEILTTTKN